MPDLALTGLQCDGGVDVLVVSSGPGGLSLRQSEEWDHPLLVPQLSPPEGLIGTAEVEPGSGELLVRLLIGQKELMDLEIDLLPRIRQLSLLDLPLSGGTLPLRDPRIDIREGDLQTECHMPAATILILHPGKEIGVNGGIATEEDQLGEGVRQLHPLLGRKDLIRRLERPYLGVCETSSRAPSIVTSSARR